MNKAAQCFFFFKEIFNVLQLQFNYDLLYIFGNSLLKKIQIRSYLKCDVQYHNFVNSSMKYNTGIQILDPVKISKHILPEFDICNSIIKQTDDEIEFIEKDFVCFENIKAAYFFPHAKFSSDLIQSQNIKTNSIVELRDKESGLKAQFHKISAKNILYFLSVTISMHAPTCSNKCSNRNLCKMHKQYLTLNKTLFLSLYPYIATDFINYQEKYNCIRVILYKSTCLQLDLGI